jgi:hypothetical protein
MALLKPRGYSGGFPAGFHKFMNVLAKIRVIEGAFDLVARDCLKNHPGVMRISHSLGSS